MENDFLTETELCERLHVSLATLRRWRLENRGPRFRKLGSLVRYGEYDLSQWMQEQPCGGDPIGEKISPKSARSESRVRKFA
jgi:excisionase family DNA binding protein